MPKPPLYRSRATQVALHLRERILANEWPRGLPSERGLEQELGVGRRTVRAALRQLEGEGVLLPGGERRKSQIPPPEATAPTRRRQTARQVGFLLLSRPSALNRSNLLMVDALRRFLARRKVELCLHDLGPAPKQGVLPYFRRLYRQHSYEAWLLSGSNRELQAWCEAERLPVILASAAFPGIGLPGVELGFERTCHHAVGQMVRAGHRHLAFLLPELPANIAPGDRASRAGFLEGVAGFGHLGASGRVELFSREPTSLPRLIDRLLARRPRPTAWLIRKPYFITVLVRLLQLGIRIPEEVSLVCRDSDDFFPDLPIAPSCYVAPPEGKARLLGSLAMRLLGGERLPPICHTVLPEWEPGQTLGKPPRGAVQCS